MRYRIIITQNGKKRKILYEGSNESNAKEKYFKTKDKNKVLLPKKNNAYKKIKPVIYELLLLKEKEDSDTDYFDRDELGRTIPIKLNSDKWSLIHKSEYFYEEKFSVYGYKERMDTKKILKLFILNKTKEDKIKQINYINNKLLIHQNSDFDIIVCKNSYDTKRLYKVLMEFCETNKVKNILFTGSINRKNRTKTYKRIVEKTGWTINKTYRSSTRP
jgi:hypothetical protein